MFPKRERERQKQDSLSCIVCGTRALLTHDMKVEAEGHLGFSADLTLIDSCIILLSILYVEIPFICVVRMLGFESMVGGINELPSRDDV